MTTRTKTLAINTHYKTELHAARHMLAASQRKVIEHREKIKELVAERKAVLAHAKKERDAARDFAKTVRLDKAAAKAAARDQKRAERIAKMEARLTKLKLAAGRKHGKPVVYTAEQIAALNAA